MGSIRKEKQKMAILTNIYLGKTNNGIRVYDRPDSHFHEEGGLTLDLLKEALRKIQFPDKCEFKKYELNFKRPIGHTTCVQTTEDDNVVMVYRKGRKGMTPMVKNRDPKPCDYMTVILRKDDISNHLTLITAFIGSGSTPEPWDKRLKNNPRAKQRAEAFWATHALIYDESLIDWERTHL